MAGTVAGGLKASQTNKTIHGSDFYQRIGQLGGQRGHTGGFYANRELARTAGALGGKISKRGPAKIKRGEVIILDAEQYRAMFPRRKPFWRFW